MKPLQIVLAASLALAACSSMTDSGSGGQGATASSKDVSLMRELAQANLAEVDAGKLAQSKARSEAVKQFAQQMVDEHSKMMQEGKQLAAAKGMELPSSPGLKHQVAKKRLEMGSSDNFDKAYPSLKAYAEKAIPHVQQHLQQAEQLAAQTK